MFGLTGLRLYGALGAAVALALFLAWVWRIDSLRAHYKRSWEAEKTSSILFAERVRLTSETIVAKAEKSARRVETAQTQAQQESDNEIRQRIAAAVRAVQLRAGQTRADTRSGGNDLPQAATAAGSPSGTSQAAELATDDLTICTENTIKLDGWQSWWRQVSTIDRGN